jgi:hypothetical protein
MAVFFDHTTLSELRIVDEGTARKEIGDREYDKWYKQNRRARINGSTVPDRMGRRFGVTIYDPDKATTRTLAHELGEIRFAVIRQRMPELLELIQGPWKQAILEGGADPTKDIRAHFADEVANIEMGETPMMPPYMVEQVEGVDKLTFSQDEFNQIADGMAEGVYNLEMQPSDPRLNDMADIGTNKEDADFWIVRKGSEDAVGKPTRTYSKEHIGVKVTATDQLNPDWLYYAVEYLHASGYFKQAAHGATNLKNIKVSDVKGVAFSRARKGFAYLPFDEIRELPKEIRDKIHRLGGFAQYPHPGDVVKVFHDFHDWIYTFGEVKRTHPELYKKLMDAYGKRNAGIEAAVSLVEKAMEGVRITRADAVQLALTYEDRTLDPPNELRPLFERIVNVMEWLERTQISEGVFQKPFQERMIEENNLKIADLQKKRQSAAVRKQVTELLEENKQLRNMRYLPHTAVAQSVIRNKINTLDGEKRKAFTQQITGRFKKRQGRLMLKDYLEMGLVGPKDIDIRKLMADSIADYYYRSSMKSIFDYGRDQGLIKDASKELREQGWLNAQEIGIRSSELKEKLVHPLLASQLNEMALMKAGHGGDWISTVMSMVKIGQFIKPTIIWVYNSVQKYMKGMYALNPVTEATALADAMKSVITKDDLYHQLNESNLFQFPYEISRAGRDEAVARMVSLLSKDTPKWKRMLEKMTSQSWDMDKIDFKKIFMFAHNTMGQLTWEGDKIQRTASYLNLRKMGYPHDEAVGVAAQSHGAYSLLSSRYKKLMSKIFFVYSFRFLMPVEIGKILAEPVYGTYKWAAKGEKPESYKVKRWIKALLAATLVPVMIDEYMKWRGFKKEGKHIGPLAWKWKKKVTDPTTGDPAEIVVGMNNILNMPVKYWNRFAYADPTRPENVYWQKMKNFLKWELHPLYRIFIWDLQMNRRSFGSGMQVYDPSDPAPLQLLDSLKYVFGQSFRFLSGVMDAAGEGTMTDKERANQKAIYKAHLNKLD